MNFVFISPNFPEAYRLFCMRLAENGIRVLGVGDCPYDQLHPELRDSLQEYYKVDTLENYEQVFRAVAYFSYRYGKIDWIESNNEYWLEQDARLRTEFNVTTGLKEDQIARYRSKTLMKTYYTRAGIPAARYLPLTDLSSALEFTDMVGYPVVAKPDRGVGASATYKLKSEEDVRYFLNSAPPVPYLLEEFVPGEVTTYDGICNSRGEVLFAASHITPDSIMDMANEHTHCFYYVDKEIPPEVEEAGRATLKAFEASSRFFHLEFFRLTKAKQGLGQKGDIVALEVNMRPAGGFTPDMINFSQSVDVYRLFADMVAYDHSSCSYDGPHSYCAYAGRRDECRYVLSDMQLEEKYNQQIRLSTRMPDALSGVMGNRVFVCCFNTKKEMDDFRQDAFLTT